MGVLTSLKQRRKYIKQKRLHHVCVCIAIMFKVTKWPLSADDNKLEKWQSDVCVQNGLTLVHLDLHRFFQIVTPEKYEVKGSIQEAAIILTSCTEPKMQVTITLTSPVIREENGRDGGWKTHHSLPHCTSFSCLSCSLYETSFSMLVDTLKSTVLLALLLCLPLNSIF